MRRIADCSELTRTISQVARLGSGYSTNFFASAAKIDTWIAAGTLSVLQAENALLIVRHDGTLVRIHHVASDPQSLRAALAALVDLLPDSILVADLVGRPESLDGVAGAYRKNGFAIHTRLVRMQRIASPPLDASDVIDVESAGANDVSRLRDFMERWLDPLSEQIQEPAELAEAVRTNQVLVVRQGNELAGMLIHETIGFSTTLRYWHVDGCHRNRGVGGRLMRAFLDRCASSRRIALWVIANNVDAIRKYHHYGFREEGLSDVIMVRQKEATAR